jgi:hypothetical protein
MRWSVPPLPPLYLSASIFLHLLNKAVWQKNGGRKIEPEEASFGSDTPDGWLATFR